MLEHELLQVLAQTGAGSQGSGSTQAATTAPAVVVTVKTEGAGATETTVAVAASQPTRWPTRSEMAHGAGVGFGVLMAGLLVFVILRKHLIRAKLVLAMFVLVATLAIYAGLMATVPAAMRPEAMKVGMWRLLSAGLLFVGLCLLDRLVLVPLLTRGGKISLPRFVHQVIVIVGLTFAILGYGAHEFEWNITNFLAGSAVVSIVLGLALQETLGNFFSGMVMQTSSPFAIGHWIQVGTVEGRVVDMTWRAVTLQTSDDNFVHIPNSTVARDLITNFNTPTTATARNVFVGIEYEVPPADAMAVLKVATLETPGVSAVPEPYVYVRNFGDSSVDYRIKFWIIDPPSYPKIEHAVRMNIWYRLKQRGMDIPYPLRTLEVVSLDRKEKQKRDAAAALRLEAIEQVPLFASLNPAERKALAEESRDVLLAANQVLFRQDDAGDSFYIIRHGTVDVIVRGEGGSEKTLATLGPGDYFGEMSGLTGQPRSATIKAASPLVCVEIGKAELHALFAANLKLMETVSEVVGKRAAERQAALDNLSASAKASAAAEQQRSIMSKMLRFFGLGGR